MVSEFDRRFPAAAQACREFYSMGDETHGMGFASAFLLQACVRILELDVRIQRDGKLTKENVEEASAAIRNLREAYTWYDEEVAIRHQMENDNRSLH